VQVVARRFRVQRHFWRLEPTGSPGSLESKAARHGGIFRRTVAEESGQDLIEYGLLVGIITALGAAVIPAIGTKVAAYFNNLNAVLP
jgi:Flp pilus assembly pilin Flp